MATWEKVRDNDLNHTAMTMYIADGYRIWKGKRRINNTIYSSDEWHLERISDRKVLWNAKTAKECKENFDYALLREAM